MYTGTNTLFVENRALLGYYTASSGNFLPTFRDDRLVPPFFFFFSVGLQVANAPDVLQPCDLLYYP